MQGDCGTENSSSSETEELTVNTETINGVEEVEMTLEDIIDQDIPVEVEIEGDLVLKEQIGDGYYGPVFRVSDEGNNVDFAIKSMPNEISSNPVLLQNVQDKFDEATYLNHKNIACISDIHEVVGDSPVSQQLGVSNGAQLIVMEFIDGQTVDEWVKQFPDNKADFASATEICSQVAQGLDYAHGQGITVACWGTAR